MVNVTALRGLGRYAHDWARAYVQLAEALLMAGVPEAVARMEAREAANTAAFAWHDGYNEEDDEDGEPPPPPTPPTPIDGQGFQFGM